MNFLLNYRRHFFFAGQDPGYHVPEDGSWEPVMSEWCEHSGVKQ